MRWRNYNAVGEMLLATAVIHKNGMRNHRRRSHTVVTLDECLNFISRKYLQRGALRWTGQPVSILAHIERAVDPPAAPAVADGLRNGQNMRLGKRAAQRRAAVPAGSETDQLVRISNVGSALVIFPFESGQIY